MKHTISVLVENKPGVLARISGLFSARGFNIDSLAVGETNDQTMSRMTIVVNADEERILEQIKKQLYKLIDVITVEDLTKRHYYERELVLVKIEQPDLDAQVLAAMLEPFHVHVLEIRGQQAILESTGNEQETSRLVAVLRERVTIKELVRTGRIAIAW